MYNIVIKRLNFKYRQKSVRMEDLMGRLHVEVLYSEVIYELCGDFE